MLNSLLQLAGGMVLLLVGGRFLVSGAVDTARKLRVSPLIGLTLVAWGTSAPELALNLIAALKGRSDLAVGNVVGANICNMAAVLGVCALMRPLIVEERLIKVEIWFNAAMLLAIVALALFIGVDQWGAAVMLAGFLGYSVGTIAGARRESRNALPLRRTDPDPIPLHEMDPDAIPTHERPAMSWTLIMFAFAGGLALLTVGGSLASDGATSIALALGVPAAIVGVTVVSFGTTLPELTTSVVAVRRGATDLAIGNAIGSCIFNSGMVFGVTGIVTPLSVDGSLTVALVYMGVLAVVMILISRTGGKTITRVEGAVLLASYGAFIAFSTLQAMRGA